MDYVLATSNLKKLAEIKAILGTHQLIPQHEFGVADVEETGLTFVENAILKARHAARASGLPAIADDSGLQVDALNGAPGIRSARYAGDAADDNANISLLLEKLNGVPLEQRTARFQCVIVVMTHAFDPTPVICQGAWQGMILDAPRGANGFGYDPIFFCPERGVSAAELEPAVKNLISHRGKALARLLTSLA